MVVKMRSTAAICRKTCSGKMWQEHLWHFFFPLWSPMLWQDVTRASLYSLAVFHCFPISCPNGAAWLPSRFRWVPAIQSKRLRDTQPAVAGIVALQSNDYLQSMTSAVQCSWLTTLDMQNKVPLHATTIISTSIYIFPHPCIWSLELIGIR